MADASVNLRYVLWRFGIPKERWAEQIASWTGCYPSRAREILEGAGLSTAEQTRVSRATGVSEEDLRFGDLVREVDVLQENIRYLFDSLEHGGRKELAQALGVHGTTVSRWYHDEMRPERSKIKQIGEYFGVPGWMDLETHPLFLEPSPVGSSEKRRWVAERLEKLGSDELQELFPALKRLLGE